MSAVIRRKKYNVRDLFKYQRTEGGSKEHCCVPLCSASGQYNSRLSFHRFPKDSNLRAQWLNSIRRAGFSVTQHTKVCSRHFQDYEILTTAKGRRVLAAGSVPSLFEWNNYTKRTGVSRPSSPKPDPARTEVDCEQTAMVPMVVEHDTGASRTECVGRYEDVLRDIDALREQLLLLKKTI